MSKDSKEKKSKNPEETEIEGFESRKKYVKQKTKEINGLTQQKYTKKEAVAEYEKKKQEWATKIKKKLDLLNKFLSDPMGLWKKCTNQKSGKQLALAMFAAPLVEIKKYLNQHKGKLTKESHGAIYLLYTHNELEKVYSCLQTVMYEDHPETTENLKKSSQAYRKIKQEKRQLETTVENCGESLRNIPAGTANKKSLVNLGPETTIVQYVWDIAWKLQSSEVSGSLYQLAKAKRS